MQVTIESSGIDDKDVFAIFLYAKIMQFIYTFVMLITDENGLFELWGVLQATELSKDGNHVQRYLLVEIPMICITSNRSFIK